MPNTIWRFSDGRPGHDTQSNGLCKALEKLCDAETIEININDCRINLFHYLTKRFPSLNIQKKPMAVIGAGHKTHLPLITASRKFNSPSVVLMKPTLPASMFDYCLIPEHDDPAVKDNIIKTHGALNDIQPKNKKDHNLCLILIGGPSKNVYWNNEQISAQIKMIIDNNQHNFVIACSPRTPTSFFRSLNLSNKRNISIYTHSELPRNRLLEVLNFAAEIWVTTDSMSMTYEALSTGAKVGLIPPLSDHKNKITRAINILTNDKYAMTFDEWLKTRELYPTKILNEAHRCAKLLLEKGLISQ